MEVQILALASVATTTITPILGAAYLVTPLTLEDSDPEVRFTCGFFVSMVWGTIERAATERSLEHFTSSRSFAAAFPDHNPLSTT